MKLLLKKIFSDRIIDFLKLVKMKYFPSSYEIEFFNKQKELLITRKKFYTSFINSGDLCFDVGANVGNRIDPLLELGARVIAIEPQKSCYDILNRKYGNKIIIIKKGLGALNEFREFYISESSVLSSFSKDWISSVKANRFKQNNWKAGIKIEMTTLDNLISQYGVPSFIKIDVEGYELEVLKGLNTAIKLISFEYTTPEQIDRAIACIERLETINNNLECNYCIGESMLFEFDEWVTSQFMKDYIKTKKFINSGFGDIYIKYK